MPKEPDFYSVNEVKKPADKRRYHNNTSCAPGKDIKVEKENRPGTNGYTLCEVCDRYNKEGK